MNNFPLLSFLTSLEADGFRLTIKDYERIAHVLSTGDRWTAARLRGILTALLAKDEEQKLTFVSRFNEFFDTEITEKSESLDIDIQKVLLDIEQFKSSRPTLLDEPESYISPNDEVKPINYEEFPLVRILGVIGLITSLLGMSIFLYTNRDLIFLKHDPIKTPEEFQDTVTVIPDIEPQKPIYKDVPVIKEIVPHPIPSKQEWQKYALTSSALLFLLLVYAMYIWHSRKVPKDKPPNWNKDNKRWHFPMEEIGGKPAPQLDEATLAHLADSMGYFKSEQESRNLDVPLSIDATTSNGGIPALVFYKRKQIRNLIILVDLLSEPLSWNTIAQELAQGFSGLGVPLILGKFLGNPEQFFTDDGQTHYLEDLESERHAYLLLIFSDSKGIHSPQGRFVLESLARWPMVAWMELRIRELWDESTSVAAHYDIPLFPATKQGLNQAFKGFLKERAELLDYSDAPHTWLGVPPQGDKPLSVYLEELLGHALPLAQACSMIQPVTFGMIDALRREKHEFNLYQDIPPESINLLTAIPGTTSTVTGLTFSPPVLSMLRSGFAIRHSKEDQDRILNFIVKKVDEVEPGDEDSPSYLTWKWKRERIHLELEPDKALGNLSQLSMTPLKGVIESDMEYVVCPESKDASPLEKSLQIPLLKAPETKDGRQRLGIIAKNSGISTLEAYPIAWKHKFAYIVLLVVFFICSGYGVVEYLRSLEFEYRSSLTKEGELMFAVSQDIDARARLEKKERDKWKEEFSDKITTELKLPLKSGYQYRLTAFGKGYANEKEFKASYDNLEVEIIIDDVEDDLFDPLNGMEFVKVLGGCYVMGYNSWTSSFRDDKVCVDDFWIGRHEITQGQWRKVMGNNPSHFKNGDNYPVEQVSWDDVQKFIKKLNEKSKQTFRLPIEAEWEYACRSGGRKERFSGLSQENDLFQYANFCDANCVYPSWKTKKQNDGYKYASPVGNYKPNGIGLYDLLGNVYEWVSDDIDVYKYEDSGPYRVIRGGSWGNSPKIVNCDDRNYLQPNKNRNNLGFRLVRN